MLLYVFVSQRGDNPLHIAVRGRSKRITDFLLRNPKNARLLYTKNKAGETPYQIDAMHDRSILSQVFAASEYTCGLSCWLQSINQSVNQSISLFHNSTLISLENKQVHGM